MSVNDRLNAIDEHTLVETLKKALSRWTYTNPNTSIHQVKSIYIIGSVVTTESEFTPGKSDIDVALGTNEKPDKAVTEWFWQDFNDHTTYQDRLQNAISLSYDIVDPCVIEDHVSLQAKLRKPYYEIFNNSTNPTETQTSKEHHQ